MRVVTRTEKADDELILKAYAAAGIELKKNILFEFAPVNDRRGLPVSDQEYFISTSWWTTSALLRSVSRKRLIYLLQEDERMFYGAGDERLRCQETFDEAGFPVVINTKLLFDHFVEGPDAVQHFKNDGMFFEPAFRYHPMARTPSPDGRRRFFSMRDREILATYSGEELRLSIGLSMKAYWIPRSGKSILWEGLIFLKLSG